MTDKREFNFSKLTYLIGAVLFALSMMVSTHVNTLTANPDSPPSCTEICQMGSVDCGAECQKR